MIGEAARYYGSVLYSILEKWDGSIHIEKAFTDCAGFYVVNGKVPVFVKYSTRRKGPWTFNFHEDHQSRQQQLFDQFGECVMTFVCGRDGIVALSHRDFRSVLDNSFEQQEAVSVRRKHNQMYQIRGRDGELDRRVSRSSLHDILHQTGKL